MYKISNLFPFNKMVATNPSFGISAQKLDAKYDNHYNLGISMRPSLSVDKFERNKISFGAGMEESKLNSKILEVFSYDLEQPSYAKETITEHEELPFIYLRRFWDSDGKLAKEIEEDSSGNIRRIILYQDNEIKAKLSTGVSVSDNSLFITKYIQENSVNPQKIDRPYMAKPHKNYIRTKYAISLIDYHIKKLN